jgi:hypothetical protein
MSKSINLAVFDYFTANKYDATTTVTLEDLDKLKVLVAFGLGRAFGYYMESKKLPTWSALIQDTMFGA